MSLGVVRWSTCRFGFWVFHGCWVSESDLEPILLGERCAGVGVTRTLGTSILIVEFGVGKFWCGIVVGDRQK